MARRPDVPCSRGCGKLLWGGTTSLPAGERTCQPCRRKEPRPSGPRPGALRAATTRTCEQCGAAYKPYGPASRACSLSCAQRLRQIRDRVDLRCAQCGESYLGHRSHRFPANSYCGLACRERGKRQLKKMAGKLTNSSHKERARKHGTRYEDVNVLRVYARDRWVCQICRRKVNAKLSWPHPMSASLDHRLPISLGGDHTYANTQLAHLRCNMRKGTGGTDQLALLG